MPLMVLDPEGALAAGYETSVSEYVEEDASLWSMFGRRGRHASSAHFALSHSWRPSCGAKPRYRATLTTSSTV